MYPISKKRILSQHGFTLIEVMVSLAIFAIAIIGCYRLQIASSFSNGRSNAVASASTWAQYWGEELLSLEYDDTNGPRTDALLYNMHGDATCDPLLPCPHLDDATFATADGTRYVHADGSINTVAASAMYTIFWNIIDGRPMPSVKQIRIIVVKDSGMNAGKLYTQDYFKLGPL